MKSILKETKAVSGEMTHPEILRAEKFGSLDEEGVIFCSVCGEEILDGFECGFMADGRAVCGECAERDEEGSHCRRNTDKYA